MISQVVKRLASGCSAYHMLSFEGLFRPEILDRLHPLNYTRGGGDTVGGLSCIITSDCLCCFRW